jgi:FtsH-binding integral membrane protein
MNIIYMIYSSFNIRGNNMNFTKYNTSTVTAANYDAGLRTYMLQVFNLMSIALVITGIMACYASSEFFMSLVLSRTDAGVGMSPFGWVIQLAPLAMVFFLSYKLQSMPVNMAKMTFWIYAVLMGLSLGQIFYVYTHESVARAFFTTASVFGAMSLYGYTTKKDLTSLGSFLMMGVMGILLASLVNMFMASSGLSFAISILGVLIFTGLTAYDVQKIKNIYLYSSLDKDSTTKMAIYGALTLYIDFINLFVMLLRLFGSSRRD